VTIGQPPPLPPRAARILARLSARGLPDAVEMQELASRDDTTAAAETEPADEPTTAS
jgi:hypothetical protein